MKFFKLTAYAIAIWLVVTLAVVLKLSVWDECRADHSWLYCVHVIG